MNIYKAPYLKSESAVHKYKNQLHIKIQRENTHKNLQYADKQNTY